MGPSLLLLLLLILFPVAHKQSCSEAVLGQIVPLSPEKKHLKAKLQLIESFWCGCSEALFQKSMKANLKSCLQSQQKDVMHEDAKFAFFLFFFCLCSAGLVGDIIILWVKLGRIVLYFILIVYSKGNSRFLTPGPYL